LHGGYGGNWLTEDDLHPFDIDSGRAPRTGNEMVIDEGTADLLQRADAAGWMGVGLDVGSELGLGVLGRGLGWVSWRARSTSVRAVARVLTVSFGVAVVYFGSEVTKGILQQTRPCHAPGQGPIAGH